MTIRRLPAFASEEEEAKWWYDNREEHAEEFAKAMAEGRVKRGGLVQRIAEAKTSTAISLCAEDALKAVRIAEEKGLDVQAYLADLIHQALKNDLRSLSQEADDAEPASVVHPENTREHHLLQR